MADVTKQIIRSQRQLQALEGMLARQGLHNLPDTPEYREINQARVELEKCASPRLPDIYKGVLAEFTISGILTARAALDTIIACRGRPWFSENERGKAQRQALSTASTIYFKAVKQVFDGLKQLGAETLEDNTAPALATLLAGMVRDGVEADTASSKTAP